MAEECGQRGSNCAVHCHLSAGCLAWPRVLLVELPAPGDPNLATCKLLIYILHHVMFMNDYI